MVELGRNMVGYSVKEIYIYISKVHITVELDRNMEVVWE